MHSSIEKNQVEITAIVFHPILLHRIQIEIMAIQPSSLTSVADCNRSGVFGHMIRYFYGKNFLAFYSCLDMFVVTANLWS